MDYLPLDKDNNGSFPNQNASPEEKAKPEYGIWYAKGIYTSIITNQLNTTRKITIQQNRAYAMGLQDENKYTDWIGQRIDTQDAKTKNVGDTSYYNIDKAIVSPAPKVVDGVINRITNPDYKIQLNAIDSVSYTKKQKERDKLFGQIVMKKALEPLEEEVKLKLINRDDSAPQNNEDIEMFMDNGFKLPIEAGMEELCEWELYSNNFNEEVRPRVVRDLVENGKAFVRLYFDNNMRPKIRYVDIEHYYTTYTEDPYYNNNDYGAELKMYTIREIRSLSQNLTEEQLFTIAQNSANRYGNPQWQFDTTYNSQQFYNNQWSYDDFRILCLDFLFYTVDKRTYSEYKDKYGTDRFVRVPSNYKPKNNKVKYKLEEETNECEYEGLWIIGTQYMVRYGKAKNIIYPRINGKRSNVPLRKFIGVEPGLRYGMSRSMVSKIIPNLNNIQIAVLKIRHFVAEAVPPGIAIDVNRIMDVVSTMKMTGPMDVVTLYKQKGIAVYSGVDENGDPVNGKSVDFMPNGVADGLLPYMNMIKFEYDQIREITGFNDSMDAIQPDPKSLVGIQKLALVAAHMNLKQLYEAYNYGIFNRTGKTLCRMIQMCIEFGNGKEIYEPIIGKAGVDYLGFLDGNFDTELGIKVEDIPAGEDLQEINMMIEKEVAAGSLGSEDAWQARRISNPKKAAMFIAHRKRKRADQLMKEKAEQEQIIGEREKQTAIAAAEAEAMKIQAKAEADAMLLDKEYELKAKQSLIDTENEIKVVNAKTAGKIKEIEQAFKYKETPSNESEDIVPGIDDPEINFDPVDAATRID